jgi:glycosyltransferase involved in cell wall biosynthesis
MFLRASGGTEISTFELTKRIPEYKNLVSVSDCNLKKPILHQHQAHDQPSVQILKYTQYNYEKIVFVSKWQSKMFQEYLNIDPSKCIVIGNGINPLPSYNKPKDCINLYYNSTPFRGLDILIEAFSKLNLPNVYLHVFSGMGIYGRDETDFLNLYSKIKTTKNARFYGPVAPIYLHDWIARYGHIHTYPNSWAETYCMATHESQSGRSLVLCSDLGALSETVPFGIFYNYTADKEKHIDIFTNHLSDVIKYYNSYSTILDKQKDYADNLSWDYRAIQWREILDGI